MSYRLVEDPDGVSVLAAQVSEKTGLPTTQIEKDFWVTEVIRGVAAAAHALNITLVFKGGTSLSKAYRIIERFSEDVDMFVILPDGTKGERDRILKDLVNGAVEATKIEAEIVGEATTTGEKRGACFRYRTTGGQDTDLKEGVWLEIGTRGGTMPTTTHQLKSLIAEYSGDENPDAVEMLPVEVLVQNPSRTLVEKLVLLHTAHCADNQEVAVRTARHYYDVHQLLGHPEILDEVTKSNINHGTRCLYLLHHCGSSRRATPG